jgi:hypothetical protein
MADVQALFERFHQDIRTYYEINDELREKKDIIVDRVKAHLAKHGRPGCTPYLQGSYKMKVGILALDGAEYDIDVGLRFNFDASERTAAEVRRWVFEAVDGHTEDVEPRGPCIRVTYADDYHVDLVCYAHWDDALGATQYRLAHKTRGWVPADPPKLVEHVRNARAPFEDTDDAATRTDQFRRVVRYLKRWNDHTFDGPADDKPTGLALLLLAEKHLTTPATTLFEGAPDDRAAVERVARAAAATVGRIQATKPTPEYEDMFGRISEDGIVALKSRFGVLRDALVAAIRAETEAEACKELKKVFGEDFPCPDAGQARKQTAMRTAAPAIVPSSSSA